MANYSYYVDRPDANNNPSLDQPDMKVNTNSISSLISEDHIGFNQNNGGLHKQVRMPIQATIPSGTISNSGTTYVKTANGSAQIFYTNGITGNEYQLTRVDNAGYSTFADTTGWTFLPGGLILQYGSTTTTGVSTLVSFPFTTMTASYSLTLSLRNNANAYSYNSLDAQKFNFVTGADPGTTFSWMVIGK